MDHLQRSLEAVTLGHAVVPAFDATASSRQEAAGSRGASPGDELRDVISFINKVSLQLSGLCLL